MNKNLKEIIDKTIKNNLSMDKDELYCLCKKDIWKFQEKNDVDCCEYESFIEYICVEIDY